MKICITSTGDNLEAQVDPRFGRCPYFIIYDTDTDNFQVFENASMTAPSGAGIQAAQFVVNEGAEVVITGNVGPNSFGVFNASGVKIITGVAGIKVKDAVEKFKKGELKTIASSPTVPGHFGTGMGPGIGRGMGMGRGMMGYGQQFPPPPPPQPPVSSGQQGPINKEEELKFLKRQLEEMKKNIEIITRRIEQLTKEKDEK